MSGKENDEFSERVRSLKLELETYGKEIMRQTSALYTSSGGSTHVNLKSDPRNALKILKHDVMEMLTTCSAKSDYSNRFGSDLNECEEMLQVLRHISSTGDALAQCEDAIGGSDLLVACQQLAQLEQSLEQLPGANSELGSGQVCTILRREGAMLRYRFHARLKRLLRQCIHLELGTCVVNKQLQGIVQGEDAILDTPIRLTDLWTALASASTPAEPLLDESTDGLVEAIWNSLLRPLWRERKGAPLPNKVVGAAGFGTVEGSNRVELLACQGVARETAASGGWASGGLPGAATGMSAGVGGVGDSRSISVLGTGLLAGLAAGQGAGAGLAQVLSAPLGPCRMPLPQLVEHILAIVSFLASDVLLHDEARSRASRVLMLSLPAVLADTMLSLLPALESELAAFQRTADRPLREFGARLARALGQVHDGIAAEQRDDKGMPALGPSPLVTALDDLPRRFAEARRREVLVRAREVLISNYHNTMLASGDAASDETSSAGDIGDARALLEQSGCSGLLQALRFEPCQVSLACCRLLKLVLEVVQSSARAAGAAGSSSSLSHALFQSARDCFELFMAVVPHRFGETIHSSPRMGAVFYNDCHYLAHNCTLLGHSYRGLLLQASGAGASKGQGPGQGQDQGQFQGQGQGQSVTLLDTTGLIDLVPRLRALGDSCLEQHVATQSALLSNQLALVNLSPLGDEEPETGAGGARDPRDDGWGLSPRLGLLARAPTYGRGGWSRSQQGPQPNDEAAATALLRSLEAVGQQLHGVLSDEVYERAMGHLLECLVREALHPLLTVSGRSFIVPTALSVLGRTSSSAETCELTLLFLSPPLPLFSPLAR